MVEIRTNIVSTYDRCQTFHHGRCGGCPPALPPSCSCCMGAARSKRFSSWDWQELVELLHFAGPDTQLVVACLERPILNDELVTEDVDELAEREDLAIRRCGKVAIRIF